MAQLITYETPMGVFSTWEEAAEKCERADMDPCTCIKINRSEYLMVLTEMLPDGSQPIRLSNAIMCF